MFPYNTESSKKIHDIPVPLFNLAGNFLAYCCNLIISDEVREGSWVELVTQKHGENTYLSFQADTMRDAHDKARDHLREAERNHKFELSVLAFDGHLRTDNDRTDIISLQMFDLESYANRRIWQYYQPPRPHCGFALIGTPMLLLDSEQIESTEENNWLREFEKGFSSSPFARRARSFNPMV